ncbi:MAG TPA: tyrosine-type recombinase/integrase [Streptosporangiaceae bacterium]
MSDSKAAVSAHLEWMRQRGLSSGYIVGRRRLLTQLAGSLKKPVLSATPRDLARWRAGLSTEPATVTHAVSHAREFFSWAVKAGLIAASPAADIPVPRIRRGLPRPIAEDDLMRALANAPVRIRPWLVLAAWAGLRAQEIARLRVEEILLDARPPVILVSAFAAKGGRERAVPLCEFVIGELALAGLPPRGWAFPRHDGRPGPNEPWVVSQLANAYLHSCGIADTLHSLRHRFGTQTYQISRDLRLVQELLGHAQPATTAVYTLYDQSQALPAVEALPVPALPLSHRRPSSGAGS